MIFFVSLLIVAALILASIVIALAFPSTPAGKWVVAAWQDIYGFAYKECEQLLTLLKYPYVVDDTDKAHPLTIMKYSAKRVVAVGLPVLAFAFTGVPRDWYQVVVVAIAMGVSAFLLWYAAKTRT